MSDNVVELKTAANPDHVLEFSAGKYRDVLVIGWTPDGEMRVASSDGLSTAVEILGMLEFYKAQIVASILDAE